MAIAGIYNTFWNAVEGARSLPDQGLGWLHRNAYWVLASSGAATAACVDSESSFPIKNPVVLAAATLPVIALSLTRDRAFRSAIEQNDAATVRAMLDTGYSPPERYADGYTPLHWAIIKNQTEIALALIERLPVEALSIQNNNGNTPLRMAIIFSVRTEIALALIARSPVKALSIKDKDGDIPLYCAIIWGRTEIAQALIARLSVEDVRALSIQNNSGNTPLHLAIEEGQTEIALALIERLAVEALSIQDNSGYTPLHLAIEEDQTEVALALIERLAVKKVERFFIKNNNGDTALHMAIEKGQTEIAQALMIPKFPFKRRSIKCSKSIPKEILPQVLGSPNRSGLFPIQLAIDTGREEIYRTFPEDVTVLRGDPGSLVDLLARKLGVGVIPKDHPWNQPLI